MRRLVTVVTTAIVASLVTFSPNAPVSASPAYDRDFRESLMVKNRTFYPHVKDKFKDAAHFDFLNYDLAFSKIRATVRNSRGQAIRNLRARFHCHAYDDDCEYPVHRLSWNGKNARGKVVANGTYQVVFTALYEDYDFDLGEWVKHPVTTTTSATVTSGTKIRRVTITKRGPKTKNRSASGSCWARSVGRDLELGCFGGGGRARASWAFPIPAKAKKPRAHFEGLTPWRGGGRLIMRGKRISKTRFLATAEVRGDRGEWFDRVRVTYKIKKKV